MCSINDCDFDSLLISNNSTENILENSTCKKCSEQKASILLRGKDAYCGDCFLVATTHKFRASLGKSKIVRPQDMILVAHSGKAGSTALLHLIQAGMHESVHKRLIFKTIVIYIDEDFLHGSKLDERISTIRSINEQVKDFGFKCYFTTLSQILNPTELQLETVESHDSIIIPTEHDETLLNCFNSLLDTTAKEDLLTRLRQRLIVVAARKLMCNKVFLGDDMTSLSIKILENIALGRAAHLSLDASFADNRYSNLLMLRPMKDFSKKELHYYINSFKLQVIHSNNLNTQQSSLPSIRKLTEKFITELDAESNSTVSTVFRIGEKLGSNSKKDDVQSRESCILCEAQLDTYTDDKEICTIDSTSFSRLISEKGVHFAEKDKLKNDEEMSDCGLQCSRNCKTKIEKRKLDMNNVLKFFCYGCRLIIINYKTVEQMPNILYNKIINQEALENMKSEIKEFLL